MAMEKRNVLSIGTSLMLAMLISGCAGNSLELNTVQKTAKLVPGMSFGEVHQILGQPKSSKFVGDKWVLKYSLQQMWKGWVPYYVVLDKKTKKLVSWYADEEEYQRNQMMWMQTLQPILQGAAKGNASRGGNAVGSTQNGSGGFQPGGYDAYGDTFEQDSEGFPGGAYENPDSSYYEPEIYEGE